MKLHTIMIDTILEKATFLFNNVLWSSKLLVSHVWLPNRQYIPWKFWKHLDLHLDKS